MKRQEIVTVQSHKTEKIKQLEGEGFTLFSTHTENSEESFGIHFVMVRDKFTPIEVGDLVYHKSTGASIHTVNHIVGKVIHYGTSNYVCFREELTLVDS